MGVVERFGKGRGRAQIEWDGERRVTSIVYATI